MMPFDLTNLPEIVEDADGQLRQYIVEPDLPQPKPWFHPKKVDIKNLFFLPPLPSSTTIVPKRDRNGKIIDFIEVSIEDAGSTATNSMSMRREPGPKEQETRGSSVNFPFWPGGFDVPEKDILELDVELDLENDLLTVPPGFTEGMTFTSKKDHSLIDILSLIEKESDIFNLLKRDSPTQIDDENEQSPDISIEVDVSLLEINRNSNVLKISETESAKLGKTDWAEALDVTRPIKDFHLRIPEPAQRYDFELDTFQKQAILKLEEHHNVFVAAHTSAGKTVVAEYAIALSRKHMTRTIYTSPIKALSNQKYHDFKQKFGDVGLITGDIQIDANSSCLIMTTEILRSMLYCGSDVTRDLEYVIFDEVHYITDADRGHVWEEALILLPDHVCIVMLSATVPNTLEFADWVGRTKKRKVFVISTFKRPVPLQHFLYTGCGGKSKDDIFLIVDESGDFKKGGYEKAKASKLARQKDMQKAHNVIKSQLMMNQKQEKTLLIGLVDHLRKNDKLPVIAFTLSRNRCDGNAEALSSVDLCTASEKHKINSTFQRCLQRLKPIDRQLPQVRQLQTCLERGVGVHHSGILPILKEVVEILFEQGLVKLLFATETLAIGVNLPARTVVFDSIDKFNGKERRVLQSAEYTQMAGRAGRRGKDKQGTVIIICKQQEIPPEDKLRLMILGKPKKLESQFRLTYAMILNLLRVESISVEDMMTNSFKEVFKQCLVPENRHLLEKDQKTLETLNDLSDHLKPLCEFYDKSYEYIKQRESIMIDYYMQQKVQNELKPGRVLVVTYKRHYNQPAILLATPSQLKRNSQYKVLLLINQKSTSSPLNDEDDLWHKIMALSYPYKTFIPDGLGNHEVVNIAALNIDQITKTILKVECDKILQNWEQRQIPRFKDSPPSASVIKAVADLKSITDEWNKFPMSIQLISYVNELGMFEVIKKVNALRESIRELEPNTNIANFDQEFSLVYERRKLETRIANLQFQLSKQNLALYPDYCNKLKVLEQMNYVDSMQQVTMKGRVACEMSQNELIITELVLRNTLTELDPAEIAALLSSLVFHEKTDCQPTLTKSLEESIKTFIEVDNTIQAVELSFNVGSFDDTQGKDKLNFGLVEVVYEWARNKPFAEIMELTDVKEGIIVRCIQQLNEILKDVKDAARIIGNPTLPNKMEEASNAIKRDIVFAGSLYLNDNIIFTEDE